VWDAAKARRRGSVRPAQQRKTKLQFHNRSRSARLTGRSLETQRAPEFRHTRASPGRSLTSPVAWFDQYDRSTFIVPDSSP